MATKYQDNRSVKITSPFGANVLLFSHMSAVEAISQPFVLDLAVYSEKGDLEADKVLGKPLTVSLTFDPAAKPRHFHGLVTEFAQAGYEDRLHAYRLKVRPWYWFLTRTADCRIFQGKTVPQIFTEVCRLSGYTDIEQRFSSSGAFEPWPYCVQYRETDFNFLSRLLEQEGIFYFFEHSNDKHLLVLTDDVAKCRTVDGYAKVPYFPPTADDAQRARDHLRSWSLQKSFQPGTYATREYDFEHPSPVLAGTSSISRQHDASKWEIFDFPADATKLDSGGVERVAKLRVQELQAAHAVARGHGDAAGLAAGHQFKLQDYPRASFNIDWLVTSTSIELAANDYASGGGEGTQFSIAIEAVDAREAYRPARITPKPLVQGAQTAVVVGPKGEEIFTDELGRVKVQFHWDRYGKQDENSSCFIRVGTPWAGKNWGAIHIPRIGQEVIVAFEEGDPDQPLIIGSVWNGSNKPPYALQANKTQSGIKSRSSKDGTGENFNEIRFEDKKGSEQLYIHAEKNQDIAVENDETHTVGHNRTKEVKNDETSTIGKNRSESVGENENINVAKNRNEAVGDNESIDIGKNQSLNVGQNRTLTIAKNHTVSVGENLTDEVAKSATVNVGKNRTVTVGDKDILNVGKQLVIDAGDSVTIQTGSASITMKKDGTITIKGKDITLDGSGKINVKASGDVVIKGSKVTQN
jgi:type VI secretion system secreted protein VgrG